MEQPRVELEKDHYVQLLIADFSDRRTEINNRTTAQHVLVSLNITAAGAITGVVFANEGTSHGLLLLLAPVCSALAMLWANHARTIRHIGWYIKHYVRWHFAPDPSDELWRWEWDHSTFVDRKRRPRGRRSDTFKKWTTYVIPVILIFIGPGIFGLIASHHEVTGQGGWREEAGYWAAVAMVAYAAIVLATALGEKDEGEPSRTSSGRRSGSASDPS